MLFTDDMVYVQGITGTPGGNGSYGIEVIDSTHVHLRKAQYDNSYIGGGTLKNHVGVDKAHKLIRKWDATDAAVHDSQKLDDVLDLSNPGKGVWADSAYRSVQIEAGLKAKSLQSRIHRRAARRAGEVQDRDDEPRLQHPPAGSARANGGFARLSELTGGVRVVSCKRTARSPARHQNGSRSGTHLGMSAATASLS